MSYRRYQSPIAILDEPENDVLLRTWINPVYIDAAEDAVKHQD
jgi:hypothetical protein